MSVEQLGPYILALTGNCFPLGEASLALGGFATLRPGWPVCYLGCGGGTLLLLLARREPSLFLTGIERMPGPAETARRNLAQNGLSGRIITGDLRDRALLPNEGFSLAVSNPPYFPVDSGRSAGPHRSEETCTLDELCAAANRILRTGGRFALVHRPERLCDLLAALRAHRLEPKRLRFAAHDASSAPSAVLVEAVKNGRPGLAVLPTLLRQVPSGAQPQQEAVEGVEAQSLG